MELWARQRQLPGVGVADLLDYRQEHPEATWTCGGDGGEDPLYLYHEDEEVVLIHDNLWGFSHVIYKECGFHSDFSGNLRNDRGFGVDG